MKFNFKKIINLNVLLIFLSISQSIQKLSAQFDITLTNPKKNWGEFFKKIKEVKKTGSVMPIEQLNLIQNNIINLRKNEDYQWVKRFSEKKTITSK